MLRVIAGSLRGRRLEVPPGDTTRPITDRVKETLFNILGAKFALPGELPDFAVLDVFAGAGSFGIETVSRGARTCIFVERDRDALRCLRQNIRTLHLESVCRVVADNAWTMRPPAVPDGYGLVFVDPPYRDAEDPLKALDLLERLAPALAPDGLIVFRQSATALPPPADQFRALRLDDERTYRFMRVQFLARRT
jgi:16S rRNA (guanine(966)-N(2))-methyltransferase RsmD